MKNDFHQRAFALRLSGLLCGMLLTLSVISCSSTGDAGTIEKSQSFQITFLQGEKTCSSPDLGMTWETAWPVLKKAYPANVIHRVNLDGIQTYNWTEQIITLTEEESKIFSGVIRNKENPSLVCPYAFLVLLDNVPIYGGKILFSQSAVEIKYPVLYLEQDPQKFSLYIRPYHTIFQIEPDDSAWQIIKDARIEEALLIAGKLEK